MSWRMPSGPLRYRYGRVRLQMPASVLTAGVGTHVVHLVIHAPGGGIQNVVNCRVPNATGADDFVARRVAAYRTGVWRSLRLALRASTLAGPHGTHAAARPGVTPQDDDDPPNDDCPTPPEELSAHTGAVGTGVPSVRWRPRAARRPVARGRSSSRSSRRCSAPPAMRRVRHWLRTVWSNPGSVSSSASAYFQSRRPRTASAASRSVSPSTNGSTVLQHRGERQASGRLGRRPAHREQVREGRVVVRGAAKGIGDAQAAGDLGERGAGDARGMEQASPSPEVPGLTRAGVVAAMAEGPDAVLALVARVLAPVLARLEALEAERAKDSHTSGKPPSTDVTRAGQAPRRPPGTSGKRPGGQPGHPGRTLALRAQPDAVVTHAPPACARCGVAFAADVPAAWVPGERRQVFELPAVALTCTEHRVAERACTGCGATTRGAYPAEARSTAQYGPGVLALGFYLTAQHLLPVARAADCGVHLLRELTFPPRIRARAGPPRSRAACAP